MENPSTATRTASQPSFHSALPGKLSRGMGRTGVARPAVYPGPIGRLPAICLATVSTLLAVLILRVPYALVALYFVFFVGRESPAVSLRSLFMVVPIAAAVFATFGIVILTDNEPIARIPSDSCGKFHRRRGHAFYNRTGSVFRLRLCLCHDDCFLGDPAPADYLVELCCGRSAPLDTAFVLHRRGVCIRRAPPRGPAWPK